MWLLLSNCCTFARGSSRGAEASSLASTTTAVVVCGTLLLDETSDASLRILSDDVFKPLMGVGVSASAMYIRQSPAKGLLLLDRFCQVSQCENIPQKYLKLTQNYLDSSAKSQVDLMTVVDLSIPDTQMIPAEYIIARQ